MERAGAYHILREWIRWRDHWDDLCSRCGQCCYDRRVTREGEVIINYFSPCEYLDPETNLCTVYRERFNRCSHCGKVDLMTALFNPTLPSDCAYVQTFRFWKHN